MGYSRSDRVGDLIKEEIASMIMRGDIKDPRIGFVTITHVKLSPDLKDAKVYFSQLGTDKQKEKSRTGLNNAGGYIRRALAKRLDLRHIPSVTFFFDDSLEYSEHIEKVLKEIKEGDGV
ncbi:MAG: 30S ribosome-binding factor RbfA [Thermodesulfobacteriota bacterium]